MQDESKQAVDMKTKAQLDQTCVRPSSDLNNVAMTFH